MARTNLLIYLIVNNYVNKLFNCDPLCCRDGVAIPNMDGKPKFDSIVDVREVLVDDMEVLFQQHYSKQDTAIDKSTVVKEFNPRYKQSQDWFSLLYVVVLMSCFYKLNQEPLEDLNTENERVTL